MSNSMEKSFHNNHVFQTLQRSLKCFCFYVIFCAEGTVGVRGEVVNTVDELRAKPIIEWGSQVLAGTEVTVPQGSRAVWISAPLIKEPMEGQSPELKQSLRKRNKHLCADWPCNLRLPWDKISQSLTAACQSVVGRALQFAAR